MKNKAIIRDKYRFRDQAQCFDETHLGYGQSTAWVADQPIS